MAVSAAEWFERIDAEYVREFIRSGGAAIKFAICAPEMLEQVKRRVAGMAGENNLFFFPVDAASVRLHMVQDLFFAFSHQVDWEKTAQSFVEGLFKRQGYEWPAPGRAATLNAIAESNEIDPTILRRDVRRWLSAELMRDTKMAQDFRIALTHLCLLRCLEPDGTDRSASHAPVLEWLRGESRSVGPLRAVQISSRIGRHNGHAMLRSLCHWLRHCGHAGLCALIDIRQLSKIGSATAEGTIRYSSAAVMDSYEVLRQLLDDAERLEGLLIVVIAGEEFLSGDPKRSLDAYTALKMRVWADVRARRRDNPLAPLVELGGPETIST